MRVLVAADAMAGLDPRGASEVIARAFAGAGAHVAVVPLADGGPWFAATVADFDPGVVVSRPSNLSEVVAALSEGTPVHYVDLTGIARHTWEDLVALAGPHLEALRAPLAGHTTLGVVHSGSQRSILTGLTGVVAERGRRDGVDLAETLAADTRVASWCEALGIAGDTPGSGAADGVGALFLSLGAGIVSGLDACVNGFEVRSTVATADLVVTGSDVLDFHAVGGDVVKEVAILAGAALCPVIAIVGRNFVSSRELRLAGIESAHPILEGFGDDEPLPAQLADVAAKVARSWSW